MKPGHVHRYARTVPNEIDLLHLDVAALRIVVPPEHRPIAAAGRCEHLPDHVTLDIGDARGLHPVHGVIVYDHVIRTFVIRRSTGVLDAGENVGGRPVTGRKLALVGGYQTRRQEQHHRHADCRRTQLF
jgi:hypothetical protein